MTDADIVIGVEKLLRQVANEQGCKDYKLQITPISTEGANYSSTLFTAKIDDEQHTLNLFVKVAILNKDFAAQIGLPEDKSFYDGEIYFYSDVCKIFRDIEKKYNISEEDTFNLPKFYTAIKENEREMLVLEDLGVKGFIMYNRFKSVDWPYATAAVRELAKFHALSIAFEKEHPQKYESFINKYSTKDIYTDKIFDMMLIPNFNICVGAVKEENREKLRKFYDNITFEDFLEMFKPVNIKVLIHSDFRPSNLLHKNNSDGSVELITLDYQTYQDGCPVIDLLYFIITGSDEEFRRQYFDQFMDLYYTELSANMTRLEIDNSCYPRGDFDQDLREKLKYGLILAAQVLPIVTVDPNEAPVLSEDITKFTSFKTSDALVERMNGIVNDYIKWGIL